MDCCVKSGKSEHETKTENKATENEQLKGGKMDKKIILWIIIAILAVAVLYIVFFKGSGTGQVVSTAGQAAGQVASGGMVGGC